jgi:hypothetical protein
MKNAQRYFSIGHLAQQFQRDVSQLQAAFEALGIRPALLLNEIAHYDAKAAEKLRKHFQKGNRNMTKFEQYVADEMAASGSTRREATATVARKCPSAHREYLQLTQSSATVARTVGRRAAPPKIVTGKAGGFLDLVRSEMENGLNRKAAMAKVARMSPALHKAFLQETNDPALKSLIAEKMEDR